MQKIKQLWSAYLSWLTAGLVVDKPKRSKWKKVKRLRFRETTK